MNLEYQLLIAFVLDLVLGDPRRFPHPVKIIGGLAAALEGPFRNIYRNEYFAGALVVITVLTLTGAVVTMALHLAALASPVLADALSIFLLYTTIAARDLSRHALDVHDSLAAGDLEEARRRVGFMVGRDTGNMDTTEVVRAAVESTAENTSDGVTAPLFWALIGGPLGAVLYKAVNTMDSLFGHRDERYGRFGWAAARLDDVFNYIPARLTGVFIVLAAALVRLDAAGAFKVMRRDGKRHPSPNAGFPEGAVAGALGVRLGGLNTYGGKTSLRPFIGDDTRPLEIDDIRRANALMWVTTVLFFIAGVFVRAAFV
ncbi:MAG TPA: adenosylcobinamide-phosphate synthase CbiB [Syntrophales bacterium]|nr:adenosylcobinamide-phosphate synthase CbiB [Syntrophales bacterium]HOM06562.1 adenosylcobinamide-phosphate synthase CbiB [Syntrophales bacterium]HON99655.1 adenosylcobinamide-phosphate synthase CbiB [Syntrophales bacterium]HPC00674.1 adenosylcobinamide-phosphate synthase CbiB [Syntrophales bacterium]HPQ06176.1 adenosylcobinamide-phosphate synthase CbiB [Syntrophales bacterium]